MHSIALFPCCFTDEAILLGELGYLLNERVVTDNMLLDDISRQFGLSKEECQKTLFGLTKPTPCISTIKTQHIDMLKFAIENRLQSNQTCTVHYGLHTSLLPLNDFAFVKILVVDAMKERIRRAIQLEGFKDRTAKRYIDRKDRIASQWTHFLFGVDPYDSSLHDIIISRSKITTTELAKTIIALAEEAGNHAGSPEYQHQLPTQAQNVYV